MGGTTTSSRPERGRGRAEAYIVPVVDHVLRRGPGRGIQAIVVYPMNALANSQYGELEKFLKHGYLDSQGPVTFARYTGQESDEERQRIIASPPDILLTNYVMLELILTRSIEQGLVQAAQDLGFLVFDELHTDPGPPGCGRGFPDSARPRAIGSRRPIVRRHIGNHRWQRHLRGATSRDQRRRHPPLWRHRQAREKRVQERARCPEPEETPNVVAASLSDGKDEILKATGTLFSNLLQGQQHFVVPLFQRPYTWEGKTGGHSSTTW